MIGPGPRARVMLLVGMLALTGWSSPFLSAQEPTAHEAMIVATTAPRAIRAGMDVMLEGGTAADAVLTTALAQTALAAGCWVSYAGRMTVVYYEAETGRVHGMNACYDAPREETDPHSIPRQGTPSGRTVLVPGFMAGVEALHRRHGRRPFARIFAPAIEIAEDGVPLSRSMARLISRKATVLTRLPATRGVFTRPDGKLYEEGDLFRQPELAGTLRQVARDGAAHMYTGEWARAFVDAVQAEGGKLTLADLAAYRVRWETPLSTTFRQYHVYGLNPPNRGGPIVLRALDLLEAADLRSTGHYTTSAASLSKLYRVELGLRCLGAPRAREILRRHVPELDIPEEGHWKKSTARALWKCLGSEEWPRILAEIRDPGPKRSEHSDAVVAVDRAGNVAAILHTINTGGWGTTGLFVEGVSIPDSGAFQQGALARVGPGGRLPDHGPPMLVLRDGRPVLAGSATGSGNFTATWQNFLNVLEFGRSPAEAARTPNLYLGRVRQDAFPPALIEAARERGDPIESVPRLGGSTIGFWVGIRLDPRTRTCEGGKIPLLDGIVVREPL